MTAFFNKGATRITVEPVPVADLLQKWIAMLDNRKHLDSPGRALCPRQKLLHRRHVAILHRDPDRRAIITLESLNPAPICRVGK